MFLVLILLMAVAAFMTFTFFKIRQYGVSAERTSRFDRVSLGTALLPGLATAVWMITTRPTPGDSRAVAALFLNLSVLLYTVILLAAFKIRKRVFHPEDSFNNQKNEVQDQHK